jgi:uncharacterized membrane protein
MLSELFNLVCGRAAGHVWAIGGIELPFCQRCTGLYVGATVALVGFLILRPVTSPKATGWYGLCLLQMVPLGFHWVPQNDVVRAASGWVFAIGLVGLLWRRSDRPEDSLRAHAGGWTPRLALVVWGLCLLALLATVRHAGRTGYWLVSAAATVGLAGLILLCLVNLVALFRGLRVRR